MRGSQVAGEQDFNHELTRWGKAHVGGHDMVRRGDPNGETLVWCKKCSGDAWCRLVHPSIQTL